MANNELLTLDDQTLASIMNKRHRSAKSFKSPPQPKFCIKESYEGREVYINVLSYSRIANQLSALDPVPLYGGMIIKSYSSLKNSLHQQQALQGIGNNVSTPPPPPPSQLIFAVMASPEVLKKVGRNFPATTETNNLIELMCEFCEAMNPWLKLSKKPEILKDRDIQGELKDIWTAVQNFREKEKSGASDIVVYTEFGPESAVAAAVPSLTPLVKDCDINDSMESSLKVNNSNHELLKNPTSEILSSKTDTEALTFTSAVEMKEEEEKHHVEDNAVIIGNSQSNSEPKEHNIEIDKLSISDNKKSKNNSTNNGNEHNNDSSEKNIKVQNQKNKESQHHFFPKFLSSSKDKDTKDKEKDKEKMKSSGSEEQSETTKVKTKKSLNFFRRNKNVTGSPTHNNNSNSNANNIANE
ncbi:hypothetical protein PVAND_011368 [Polypedilum vanderplanki]|uniref:Uncharacterized protein n=1 Tax=Polypedilum vanderplanki TaxID=319348 RepID=A0A9J6CIC4_POLVA|nr:hypothetical protein PVAND_011368 [Polypedilum vanderplanki]